jgi:NAD(P)-dependent dehydrogenase (short-subunit alcohol dehydrogenase family)
VRSEQELAGRAAVITGGGSGLGRAMAERFAAAGMRVVVADVDEPGMQETVTALVDRGHEAVAVRTDVTDADDVERLAVAVEERFGAVHLLCNNAGVVKSAPVWDLTLDDWKWVLDVDLWGVIHGVRSFLPRMLSAGQGGHVVNTASMAGLLPMPRLAAYAAAKAGVIALSESLQHDLDAAGADIGVSVFCPGFIPTRITDSARNRPERLSRTRPSTGRRTTAGVAARMTAEQAVEQVLEAVVTRRFWVLTHEEYRPVIARRAERIGAREDTQELPPVW